MSIFSFKDYDKKEKQEIAEKQKSIKEATQQAEEVLRQCIQSDNFKKYRAELEKSDKALIEAGIKIMHDIVDINKRVALYDQLFVRAEILGLLLKGILRDKL